MSLLFRLDDARGLDRIGPGRFVLSGRLAAAQVVSKSIFPAIRLVADVGQELLEAFGLQDLARRRLIFFAPFQVRCRPDLVAFEVRLACKAPKVAVRPVETDDQVRRHRRPEPGADRPRLLQLSRGSTIGLQLGLELGAEGEQHWALRDRHRDRHGSRRGDSRLRS
jgi:hypothetical protein